MDYYKKFLRDRNWPFEYPMPFFSPTPNERIRVQRGFFTVHGNSNKPLEKICAKHVQQVLIPKDAIPEAIEFLKLAGIDHNFLFPDQEGWLKKVEQDYFYAPEELPEP
ncbi:MAG: hypothetical protein JOZ51_22390 [Chloroflexi bacterium]|nr:hypothetical protein [Chloroflexota bacterium]